MKSMITIIEVGTNNAEFLTIKALKAIEKAKRVIIKGGIDKKIVDFVSKKAKIFFVEENQVCTSLLVGNALLITTTEVYEMEEVDFLKANKIPFELIPAVKPFLAYPALNKIPVTRRGVNLGFIVVKEKMIYSSLANYINIVSETKASLLICNNFSALEEIVQLFKIKEMGSLPLAIFDIMQDDEKWIISTIDQIQETIYLKNISSSAITLVGEVVKQHQKSGYREIEELVFNKI